jgi:hypothetical protein
MYEVFKLIGVIAVILWAVKDKINEPRNVKYCCDKEKDELPPGDLPPGDLSPGDSSPGDLSQGDEPGDDIVSLEDLYGDYSHLNGISLSTNTSVNTTFVQRGNQARWISPIHASI